MPDFISSQDAACREAHWLLERNVQPPQYLTDGGDVDPDPWRAMRFSTERALDDRGAFNGLRDEMEKHIAIFLPADEANK